MKNSETHTSPERTPTTPVQLTPLLQSIPTRNILEMLDCLELLVGPESPYKSDSKLIEAIEKLKSLNLTTDRLPITPRANTPHSPDSLDSSYTETLERLGSVIRQAISEETRPSPTATPDTTTPASDDDGYYTVLLTPADRPEKRNARLTTPESQEVSHSSTALSFPTSSRYAWRRRSQDAKQSLRDMTGDEINALFDQVLAISELLTPADRPKRLDGRLTTPESQEASYPSPTPTTPYSDGYHRAPVTPVYKSRATNKLSAESRSPDQEPSTKEFDRTFAKREESRRLNLKEIQLG